MALTTALNQLRSQLQLLTDQHAGYRRLVVSLPDGGDSLNWLQAQPCWPQLWWQQRNGRETIAACGALHDYHDLQQAQAASDQLPADWRIWGANDFALQQSTLFLPRLVWRRSNHRNQLQLFLHSESSLREDAQLALHFLDQLQTAQPFPSLNIPLQRQQHWPEQPDWRRMVDSALTAIAAGGLDKVVLARATDLWFSQPVSAAALLAASRRVNHHCYHFMLAFDPHHAFIGSSPERLFLRQQSKLLTEALAGTVACGDNAQQKARNAHWLRHDDKNQRENWLVVDDICQRLQERVSELEVLPADVLRLRQVQHLRRVIRAQLRQRNDQHFITRLQPTAAVAGYPRQAARDFIRRHEPFNRQWYAGSLGYLSRQKSEFTVSLRSAFIEDRRVRLYAGAGIVAGSDALQEWQEIDNKSAALASLLGGGLCR